MYSFEMTSLLSGFLKKYSHFFDSYQKSVYICKNKDQQP